MNLCVAACFKRNSADHGQSLKEFSSELCFVSGYSDSYDDDCWDLSERLQKGLAMSEYSIKVRLIIAQFKLFTCLN